MTLVLLRVTESSCWTRATETLTPRLAPRVQRPRAFRKGANKPAHQSHVHGGFAEAGPAELLVCGGEGGWRVSDDHRRSPNSSAVDGSVPGFGVEPAPYGMQTQSYPKGGLLDSMCPPAAVPGALSSEQEFPMFPKAQLSTVGVGYCSVGQDFAGSTLNLMASGPGKELSRVPWSRLWSDGGSRGQTATPAAAPVSWPP